MVQRSADSVDTGITKATANPHPECVHDYGYFKGPDHDAPIRPDDCAGTDKDDHPSPRSNTRKRLRRHSSRISHCSTENNCEGKVELEDGESKMEGESSLHFAMHFDDRPGLRKIRRRGKEPDLHPKEGEVPQDTAGVKLIDSVGGANQRIASGHSGRKCARPLPTGSSDGEWNGKGELTHTPPQDRTVQAVPPACTGKVPDMEPIARVPPSALAASPFQSRVVLQARIADLEAQNAALQRDNAILGVAIAESRNTARNNRGALLSLDRTTTLPRVVLTRLLGNAQFLASWPVGDC